MIHSTSYNIPFQTETALVYDAVHLFARALTDADMSQDITPARLSCSSAAGGGSGGGSGGGEGGTWQHGSSLLNYMKLVSFKIFLQIGRKGFCNYSTL